MMGKTFLAPKFNFEEDWLRTNFFYIQLVALEEEVVI